MFPTQYNEILSLIDKIDPVAYCRTRNYGNGAVTKLSPYISRGVISTKQVYEQVMARGFNIKDIEQFVKELCWRDYFQRVGQHKTDELLNDTGREQEDVKHYNMPTAIHQANTGIEAIDNGIKELYATGYMHNHMRMYVASITTNIAKAHWQLPAQWLYYHLLDADFASNICSWQWVCAVRSGKRYFANQENINKFFKTNQRGTFLDTYYDAFEHVQTPPILRNSDTLSFETELPTTTIPKIDNTKPTCVYNIYNLDPLWRSKEDCNRILLLEPSHFKVHAVSAKTIEFVQALSKNIENIQVYVAEFSDLQNLCNTQTIYFKEHPLFRHYKGKQDSRDWIVPSVDGFFSSFFGFWKKVEKHL